MVPYRGPNETYRRPIYIECREGKVILQPEGVTFSEADFLALEGPNNPLAAALRAAIEYYRTIEDDQSGVERDEKPQDAYPLILVRPDGVGIYPYVLAAIKSWDDEFGYEMIDQDWELAFPPPNPELSALEYRAAAESRAMRAHLTARRSHRVADFSSRSRGGGDTRSVRAKCDGQYLVVMFAQYDLTLSCESIPHPSCLIK